MKIDVAVLSGDPRVGFGGVEKRCGCRVADETFGAETLQVEFHSDAELLEYRRPIHRAGLPETWR